MEIVLAVAVVVGVVGAAVPVWLHRREHPAREIRYGIEVRPLLDASMTGGAAALIRVQGREVQDPHKVAVRLYSAGRADVPSALFDGGQSLVLDLGAPIVPGTFSTGMSRTGLGFTVTSGQEVAVGPGLISKDFDVPFEALVEGRPHVSVRSPLVDVPVIPEQQPPAGPISDYQVRRAQRKSRISALRITLAVTIAAAVLLIGALVIYQIDTKTSAALGGVAILVLMMCTVAFVVIGIARLARFVTTTAQDRATRRR